MEHNEAEITEQSKHTIYRFKFTDSITELLSEFSKIHSYDTRKDYKAAWLNF